MSTDQSLNATRPEDEMSVYLETEALRQELASDEEYCYAYAESFLNTLVASQIRTIREQRGMTQKQLGRAVGTPQAGISRLESINYSSWKTETLRRLARALHVRLDIRFRPLGTLLDDASTFGPEALRVEPREKDHRLQQPRRRPVSMAAGSPTPSSVRLEFMGAEVEAGEWLPALGLSGGTPSASQPRDPSVKVIEMRVSREKYKTGKAVGVANG